ncbi:MAG: hypothetical protein ACP5QI_06950 [Candidatus Bathyarchaeia archaeon]
MEVLKDRVEEAVKEYNLYRSPEAEAEILEFEGAEFTMIFRGAFCRSCGIYDYFEDLIHILKKRSIISEIVNVREDGEFFRVKYRIKL